MGNKRPAAFRLVESIGRQAAAVAQPDQRHSTAMGTEGLCHDSSNQPCGSPG
jgi:hypothetical protein